MVNSGEDGGKKRHADQASRRTRAQRIACAHTEVLRLARSRPAVNGGAGPHLLHRQPADPWVPALAAAGLVIAFAGVVLTLAAQRQTGASWRIGVDAGERTVLVIGGLFAHLRNPIFTGMLAVTAGLTANGAYRGQCAGPALPAHRRRDPGPNDRGALPANHARHRVPGLCHSIRPVSA
jgi:hypothetical protein